MVRSSATAGESFEGSLSPRFVRSLNTSEQQTSQLLAQNEGAKEKGFLIETSNNKSDIGEHYNN